MAHDQTVWWQSDRWLISLSLLYIQQADERISDDERKPESDQWERKQAG